MGGSEAEAWFSGAIDSSAKLHATSRICRVNVGIVNVDAAATVTFLVSIPHTTEAYSVTIPPMSMQQAALVNAADSLSQINIGTGGVDTIWVAYGSSIDNVTGDSWSELAVQPIQRGSSERDN